jgi:uncharacterized protein YjeT (DUF2065 family)
MSSVVTALGLVLVIEGVLYAFAPDQLRRMMTSLLEAPPDVMRAGGLFAVGLGLLVIWVARSFLAAS